MTISDGQISGYDYHLDAFFELSYSIIFNTKARDKKRNLSDSSVVLPALTHTHFTLSKAMQSNSRATRGEPTSIQHEIKHHLIYTNVTIIDTIEGAYAYGSQKAANVSLKTISHIYLTNQSFYFLTQGMFQP